MLLAVDAGFAKLPETSDRPDRSPITTTIPILKRVVIDLCRVETRSRVIEIDEENSLPIIDDVSRVSASMLDADSMQKAVTQPKRFPDLVNLRLRALTESAKRLGDTRVDAVRRVEAMKTLKIGEG